eukprot:m.206849 g.206849  ORF g.206849 m.206849 type:complete len:76 (-) comp15437_c0_seq5:704-931(-)
MTGHDPWNDLESMSPSEFKFCHETSQTLHFLQLGRRIAPKISDCFFEERQLRCRVAKHVAATVLWIGRVEYACDD